VASERERLRSQTTDLQQRLRGEPGVPQVLFELLDVVIRRLDRIELGEFTDPNEVPTEPGKRLSGQIAATKTPDRTLDERIAEIFDEAKKPTTGG
jgi:hypothetical protein